jgi:TolB-like protein
MMNRVFLRNLISTICLFTFLISSVYAATDFDKEIDQLSGKIAEKIAAAGKKKIAVVDFTDLDGTVTELGRFLAEEFSTALAGTGKGFTVVDRIHLKSLLREHKLSSTGLIDQDTIRRLGKIAGVDSLITGSLTPLGESVRINVKVLDIETAAVIDANRGNFAMTDAIKELMRKGIISPASTASGTSSTPISTRVETIQKIEEKNYVFEAIGCKVSGKNAVFSLLITNKDKDAEFDVRFHNTNLYDELGNEYPAKKIQLGSQIRTHNYMYFSGKVIFSGVPTKTFLTFEGISPKATMSLAIVLNCWGKRDGDKKYFAVKFRGIPLSR